MKKTMFLIMLAVMPLLSSTAVAQDAADQPESEVEKNWKFPGSSALKYTQSFYSDNWYKGGVNNHTLLVNLSQDANYAKDRLIFENKLEARLGYYTTKDNDDNTVLKINDDLLRLTSKLGIRAVKDWYYSAQLQGYTQFMNVYEDDNATLKSEFFAPVYATFSLGMDYKPTFDNDKISLSVQLSPVAYNCRYVRDVRLGPNFGIEEGKKFKQSIGSSTEANIKWNFWKSLTWTGKAQFFTSYHNIEANFENTLDYAFNKFFAIQLFVHWRFDDSVAPDPKLDYNQFKEFLTLNFTYSW